MLSDVTGDGGLLDFLNEISVKLIKICVFFVNISLKMSSRTSICKDIWSKKRKKLQNLGTYDLWKQPGKNYQEI